MTIIIADTNILYNNYWLKHPNTQLLLDSIEKLPYIWSFPQIILDELKQHLINDYTDKINKINDLKRKAKNLFKDDIEIDFNLPNLNDLLLKFDKFYDGIANAPFIEIKEYPEISHEYIAKKAIKKEKPFKQNGTGYRDAIIWENIKEYISSKNFVVFITNNKKDFFDEKEIRIHPQLQNEIFGNNIKVYKSLNEFLDEEIKHQLKRLDDFKRELENQEIEELNEYEITDKLKFLLEGTPVYVNIVEEKFFEKIMLIFSVLLCALFQPMGSNTQPGFLSTEQVHR